jgi:hypothetical protein
MVLRFTRNRDHILSFDHPRRPRKQSSRAPCRKADAMLRSSKPRISVSTRKGSWTTTRRDTENVGDRFRIFPNDMKGHIESASCVPLARVPLRARSGGSGPTPGGRNRVILFPMAAAETVRKANRDCQNIPEERKVLPTQRGGAMANPLRMIWLPPWQSTCHVSTQGDVV